MIGLDTNVLARFLMQDDPAQGAAAEALMTDLTEATPGFVCREVLVELVWVLERAYKLPRSAIAEALTGLLEARELVIETDDRAAIAVDRYRRGGAGFADQMIALAGEATGCTATVTFDRKAATLPGMQTVG
ncbi:MULTISPECIES: PIN domain-containing protein [Roseobacteraceae]|uniref:PIN domain-containing protein n=1 Tax=Roseobacteraceae TaxID=2854170 RepID=UPI00405831E2